ncbi:MAG: aspartate carbamoyltransferase [Candidatus Aenigmatarchaeota archaeon]
MLFFQAILKLAGGVFISRDIISIRDMNKEEIEKIFELAEKIEKMIERVKILEIMKGKVLSLLFFEPSTRTKLSFETAMKKLGGETIGFESIESSSIAKGESLKDMIKVVEKYCDIIVIRHFAEGAARFAAEVSEKPLINAGDGGNQHPTQTLLDLYTMKKLKGDISNLNVTLFGDLKHGRVMRSLVYGLAMFNAKITLVSPPGLEMDKGIIEEVKEKFDVEIYSSNDVKEGIKNADVIYICRLQKERFSDAFEAEKMAKTYKVTPELLEYAKSDVILLHPLPKTNEIDLMIDFLPIAKYYQQVAYGVPIRMACICYVMENE